MYVWLALFLLKERFTDYDTLFGIGILLPAVIFMGVRAYLSRNYEEVFILEKPLPDQV